jgi:hypothetical protein
MIKLVTFHLPNMSISAHKLYESALIYGCDEAQIYTQEDIDPFFKKIMRNEILETVKGGWFFSWKPYIVLDAILNCNEGDTLGYIDAGTLIVSNLMPCIDSMDQDIMLFSNGWRHQEWCKADVYTTINPGWNDFDATQVQASAMFFKVNKKSIDFCKEWYAYSLVPGLINNDQSKAANIITFAEHRYDQAILCSLQIKHGIRLHWFPSLTNQHQRNGEAYDTLLDHHRKRDNEW